MRNVRYEAGNAVAYGMDWDAALRAITLTPAEIFGVADRVGSLAPGKLANVVVWSGDPFEFASAARARVRARTEIRRRRGRTCWWSGTRRCRRTTAPSRRSAARSAPYDEGHPGR